MKNSNTALKYIAINSVNNIKVIEVGDILYMEADGSTTKIYLNNNTVLIAFKNLGFYAELFEYISFIKVHRSFIVNIAYIEKIIKDAGGQYCVIKGNCLVPISNRKLPLIKQVLHY
ncbi:LytTR family DNA-binding domain-containing protein [Mariniflexile litorale]|uniref:LytTR family DNA-binding domain-containing protein n=1 Tax=Mariniflexile litorale TaxID=3045158 RepID=A0AAU7EHK0_9FLAO|nr:LytTR family DNA-binding domain-containing protein [Mariniflexile sp. KMM 9835]MDQ8209937.1 LytTR family DNA-binding domain-containing protein [Mariniflexile sp. KMM 9835]